VCRAANGAALDDIQLSIGPERCQGFGPADAGLIVSATNTNPSRVIDAAFRYDTVPSKQHFILFDARLVPDTDRFPKSVGRRLAPLESAPIGCSLTQRSAGSIRDSQAVAVTFSKEVAHYATTDEPVQRAPDPRSALAFYLQGGDGKCPAGSSPPGLLYAVNLHPYAHLSATLDLQDDRGTKTGSLTVDLPPCSSTRIGCSNGATRPKPGSIVDAVLDILPATIVAAPTARPTTVAPSKLESPSPPTPAVVRSESGRPTSLPLNTIVHTQNVCAGSSPDGWIKTNDAWSTTVCGQPASITFNVWTLQQISDQPIGTIVHACMGTTPPGWMVLERIWNPTVCGHPSGPQTNVMVIQRSK
jgi:hypothetical protein